MPQLGETVAEGKITQWFKAAGDKVAPGENLFEIETDKVSMEVPSTANGLLAEIRIPAGEVAPVGAVVAVIADRLAPGARPGGASSRRAFAGERADAAHATNVRYDGFCRQQGRQSRNRRDQARPIFRGAHPGAELRPGAPCRRRTPLARRLAAERGIDLSKLQGSGPHGRIVARDVEKARAETPQAPAPLLPPTSKTCERFTDRRPSRRCRSIACAAPLPGA